MRNAINKYIWKNATRKRDVWVNWINHAGWGALVGLIRALLAKHTPIDMPLEVVIIIWTVVVVTVLEREHTYHWKSQTEMQKIDSIQDMITKIIGLIPWVWM